MSEYYEFPKKGLIVAQYPQYPYFSPNQCGGKKKSTIGGGLPAEKVGVLGVLPGGLF